jgi:hypothetical protein
MLSRPGTLWVAAGEHVERLKNMPTLGCAE